MIRNVVRCVDDEKLFSTSVNLLSSPAAPSNPDMHWQQKLEAAQNVLFCKELFNQLAKEAVQLQAAIPHMVIGNQITATVRSYLIFISIVIQFLVLILAVCRYCLVSS